MARKAKAKREVIGYRLDVYNVLHDKDANQPKWISPPFSFRYRGEANDYREKHYRDATKFRVYAVRARADVGVPSDFYFNSQLAENKTPQQKRTA